ncbi:MAG: hypothetical protein C0501_02225 [Isosphaera sp.]|nr:hypothetical protein [Isosphaera sp.]
MNRLLGPLVRAIVPRLPDRLLVPLLRRRPSLARFVRRGRDFVFRKYAGGLSVRIDPSNPIELVMLSGSCEAEVARAIVRFVKPGDCCLDVGANVGAATLSLAAAVGPGGRVVAVEPGPPYRGRMRRSIDLNPRLRDRITVVAAGIGAEPGTLWWQPDGNAPYNASLHDRNPCPAAGTGAAVPVETLDGLVARLALPRVDFVKVDVESMEWEVFRGAGETLRRHRPVVVFETMEWARRHRREVSGVDVFAEIDALLRAAGYSTHHVLPDGTVRPVSLLGSPPDNTLALPDPAPGG